MSQKRKSLQSQWLASVTSGLISKPDEADDRNDVGGCTCGRNAWLGSGGQHDPDCAALEAPPSVDILGAPMTYDSTVARIAGALLSGRELKNSESFQGENHLSVNDVRAVWWAVAMARAIVSETKRTEPEEPR